MMITQPAPTVDTFTGLEIRYTGIDIPLTISIDPELAKALEDSDLAAILAVIDARVYAKNGAGSRTVKFIYESSDSASTILS